MSSTSPVNQKSGLFSLLGIAAGFYLLYFAGLGRSPLMDPDEPVYGQVAKEMAAGAGWLTPHYGGKMWFDKPPLFYWLSGISTSIFGANELAARLPSALFAVAVVLLVYVLARHDFGRRAGIISAVVMATCLQQIVLATAAVTDMTFVFCLLLALYGYRRWLDAEAKARFGWMALCGGATGLGLLAKGPVAPFLLFVTFCIHLAWTHRARRLASLDALTGIAAALLVGLPWYAAMYVLHKGDFVQGFLIANNVQRFLKAEHVSQTGSWYSHFLNIPILLVLFFPWSVFLVQSLRKCGKVNDGAKLALVWFASVFVFFSLSKTILVTYIFPLYPAAAILVGAYLDSVLFSADREGKGIRKALWAGFGFSLLLMFALAKTAHKAAPFAEKTALVAGGLMVLGFCAALIWDYAKRKPNAGPVWAMGTGMVLFSSWLMVIVAPTVGANYSTRDLVRNLNLTTDTKLVVYNTKFPSVLYYTDRIPDIVMNEKSLQKVLQGGSRVIVITKRRKAGNILSLGLVPVRRSGEMLLLSNRPSADAKGFTKKW